MGGAEKQAFYIVRALAEAGADVRVFTLSTTAAYGAYEDTLRRLHVPSRSFGRLPGLPFRLMLLLPELRRFRPHIIQSVHAYMNVYAAIAGRLMGAVSVGGLRSELSACLEVNGRFSRFLLTWPDAVAVNSRSSIEEVRQSRLLDPSRVHFLPNVIDLESFEEPEPTRQQGGNGGCPCIFVGRLVPGKRVDVFLRAVAAARSVSPGVRGIVAGFGPEEARLRRLAAELGLVPDGVSFLGPRDDIGALLRQAAIFVFCSESEGTPNVILEAMAASLPVITTPAGDARDVVEGAGAGYVVPIGDVKATADAIVRLAACPALRSHLGSAARHYVAGYRATSELAEVLTRIYADVVRSSVRGYRRDVLARVGGCPERV